MTYSWLMLLSDAPGLCRQIMGLDRRYLMMDGEDNRAMKHQPAWWQRNLLKGYE